MQTVLVPFDGSACAERALQYLVTAAQAFADMRVHVLNVQPKAALYGEYFSSEMLDKMEAATLQHAAGINAKALDILSAARIKCTGHEAIGEVISEVGKAVKAFGCDTVVMGTRGMSNFSNLMLGSVASRVVHEVSVPVLLVK
ncbi:universal stress protein [Aromatoleum toluvorans]|uniref:Universal stress protein n=1 Tax=Aromatoleum toluvorans TaxID=92002 RepID=A0ABX1PT17_9RHOO|nr:universal stress protein [Aromatoleum toluvorans]NMG42493.1 universal stress protein [Aromatoleum toluvorans]